MNKKMNRIVESLYDKYDLNEELIDINQFRNSLYDTFKNIFWNNRTEQEAEEIAKNVVDTFDILLSSLDDLERRISDLEN